MAFWNNGQLKSYGIEDLQIFEARSLTPSAQQENGLSHDEKNEWRAAWRKTFPKLNKLEYLYVGYAVSQDDFEAICEIPTLKGLHIKTSTIANFSPIGKLTNLEELNFSGTQAIHSLSGMEKLTNLRNCELSAFSGIESISELTNLTSLQRLYLFSGLAANSLKLNSLIPLASLIELRELILAIGKELDISPILELKNLQKLTLPNSYHHQIIGKLPTLKVLK